MISLGLVLAAITLKVLAGVLTLKYYSSTTHALCVVGIFQISGVVIFTVPFVVQRVAPLIQWQVSSLDHVSSFDFVSR